jgi:hypothetical protein
MDALDVARAHLGHARSVLEATQPGTDAHTAALHRLAVAWHAARRAMVLAIEHRRPLERWMDVPSAAQAPNPQPRFSAPSDDIASP